MSKQIKEIVMYEYYPPMNDLENCDTVKTFVEIDYENGTIGVVDPKNHYAPPNFIFPKRGIKYTTGWLIQLQAIENAIQEAKTKLEAYKKAEQDEKDNDVTEILTEATRIVEQRSQLGGFGEHTDVTPCCKAPYSIAGFSGKKPIGKICSHCGKE